MKKGHNNSNSIKLKQSLCRAMQDETGTVRCCRSRASTTAKIGAFETGVIGCSYNVQFIQPQASFISTPLDTLSSSVSSVIDR